MPATYYPTTYIDKKGEVQNLPNPSRPFTEGVKTNNITQTFESGHEQRRVKGDPRRTFEFTYNILTEEQASTIVSFFIKCYGNVKSFLWVHPLSKEVIQCRFDMEAISKENFTHNIQGPLYKLQIKLIQVF